MTSERIILIFKKLIYVGLFLWCAGFCVFLFYIPSKQPDLKDKKYDAIVVLTGGFSRTKTAFELLEKEYASILFISGVHKNVEIRDFLKYMKNELTSSQSTTLGYSAFNTNSNVLEVKSFLNEKRINSFILITSDFHIPRSLLLMKRHNIKSEITPFPILPYRGRGIKWFSHVCREYHAVLYIIIFGGIKCLLTEL